MTGTSDTDVWVAGESSSLMHFDGTNWQAFPHDNSVYSTRSMCSTPSGTLYLGTLIGVGTFTPGVGFTQYPLGDGVYQLQCLADGRVRYTGSYSAGVVNPFDFSSPDANYFTQTGEECHGVAELGPGVCSLACGDGVTATYRDCDDGGVQATFTSPPGNIYANHLWVAQNTRWGAQGGAYSGVFGVDASVGDAGVWGLTYPTLHDMSEDLYSGAPSTQGFVAVGQNGKVLVVTGAGASATKVPDYFSSSMQQQEARYNLEGAWVSPTGKAFLVGQGGTVVTLALDGGGWATLKRGTNLTMNDIMTSPRLLAYGENGRALEFDGGSWTVVQLNTSVENDITGYWEGSDGGSVMLTAYGIYRNRDANVTIPISGTPSSMAVVTSDQIYVATHFGIYEVTPGAPRTWDGGYISSIAALPTGEALAVGGTGVVLHRPAGDGGWTQVAATTMFNDTGSHPTVAYTSTGRAFITADDGIWYADPGSTAFTFISVSGGTYAVVGLTNGEALAVGYQQTHWIHANLSIGSATGVPTQMNQVRAIGRDVYSVGHWGSVLHANIQ